MGLGKEDEEEEEEEGDLLTRTQVAKSPKHGVQMFDSFKN